MEAAYSIEDFEILSFDFQNDELVEKSINLLNSNSYHSKHNQAYWNWRFRDNPFGQSYGWYAENIKDKDLGGILLWWPWGYDNSHGSSIIYQAINGITSKKYRNAGIFLELNRRAISFLSSQNYSLCGFPNIQSYPSYKKLGWETVTSIHPYYVPLTPLRTIWRILNSKNRVNQLALKQFSISLSDLPKEKTECLQTLWDETVFKWRFNEHPLYTYHFFRDDGISIIYKIKTRGSVLEAQIISSSVSVSSKFREFIKFLIINGIDLLSYYGHNTQLRKIFNRRLLKIKHRKLLFFVFKNNTSTLSSNFRLELAEMDTN